MPVALREWPHQPQISNINKSNVDSTPMSSSIGNRGSSGSSSGLLGTDSRRVAGWVPFLA